MDLEQPAQSDQSPGSDGDALQPWPDAWLLFDDSDVHAIDYQAHVQGLAGTPGACGGQIAYMAVYEMTKKPIGWTSLGALPPQLQAAHRPFGAGGGGGGVRKRIAKKKRLR